MVKNPPGSAKDVGLIHVLGRSPREANGYPLKYSCLGDFMYRGSWWAIVPWFRKSQHDLMTKQQNISFPVARLINIESRKHDISSV